MNELEIFLALIEHMILKRLEENPKGGVKKSENVKMKYEHMLRVVRSLRVYIYDWNEDRYYNICKECDNYQVDTSGTGFYGHCRAKDRDIKTSVHEYHKCFRNTKSRWNQQKSQFDYAKEE